MFTGLVQGVASVTALDFGKTSLRLSLDLEGLAEGLQLGASVAVDGVCLTVVALQGTCASFEAIPETLARTHYATLQLGQRLNIERSLRIGDELGGHLVSGHILGTAELLAREPRERGCSLVFSTDPQHARFLFTKGFVALNGVSLTLGEVDGPRFAVHLIPETLARTNLSSLSPSSLVNLEIDMHTLTLVESVERILAQKGLR